MSKLPKKYQFIDLSDYGRKPGHWIASRLQHTNLTAIHVTTMFIITGLIAIGFLLNGYLMTSAFFIILKSILDAADGELSRLKKNPSYVGRYYDSIADLVLNFCFLLSFWYLTDISIIFMLIAFLGIQLQGTLYNFYYVILRNSVEGDTTSRVIENSKPKAFKGESQSRVNLFYKIYNILYICFDKSMYYMDKDARFSKPFPKWFMTLISLYGLGFQLLLMALMLIFNLQNFVIPFFIGYSVLIIIFICIRKLIL
ncbi:CDP-alcohol phosphatidyltransferase family protein [Flavobacteriaceae bacterium]|nr:CDP-alcohol phosphatidyltransferase family protein [Flavobacteriaceae bacterium]MDB4064025.1 CDP-alcohol phosphatidyltransferase family protein [Flavobacteriaceae bacterium]MDB4235279.1 CDP-alcohol phosphatidyltransferase family protein [bacterium]MDB4255556.1 CDP-alcohol phosphatidyltransferase family protein [Flavobacteriaceae bacterium]MDC1392074.1 CDP-alcohol phosphatidyltransferase family protein [Flavobacteriaceae bacterium]